MFTLFFIPVIPLAVKRFTQCTFCGYTEKISKQNADDLLSRQWAAAPSTAWQPNNAAIPGPYPGPARFGQPHGQHPTQPYPGPPHPGRPS